jgi:hypothetical protein
MPPGHWSSAVLPNCVHEDLLKYAGEMPAIFRTLVEQFGLVSQSASKYRLGVVALGYAPALPAVERA